MKLKEVTLPNGLNTDLSRPFHIIDYVSEKKYLKELINLNWHIFSFTIEGEEKIFFENSSISVNKSEFMILKSGLKFISIKIAPEKNSFRSLLFLVSNEKLSEFARKYHYSHSNIIKSNPVLSIPYDDFVLNYRASLLDVLRLKKGAQEKLLEFKFNEMMIYLLEKFGTKIIGFLKFSGNEANAHFMSVIENNKFNKLSLKELASLCHMSISTFKREFRKQYNSTPSQWFQNQRLSFAAYLLKNEFHRSSNVLEISGYKNLSAFTQAFKNKFGVTPKKYKVA